MEKHKDRHGRHRAQLTTRRCRASAASPVNTFVLHAEQPLVIDTGLSNADKDFVGELSDVIDPQDVRWIWITHPDRDHTGGLWKLLEAAPNARLVTTFIGVGIMSTEWTVPMDRVYLLNPGQTAGPRRPHGDGLPAAAVRQPGDGRPARRQDRRRFSPRTASAAR